MTRSRPSKDPSRPLQLQRHPETPEYTMQEFVVRQAKLARSSR